MSDASTLEKVLKTATPRAPQPAPPVRGYSFTDFQVANPSAPPPGDRLDGEFDRADNAISDVIDWVATTLSTDGSLRAGTVGSSQLIPGLFDNIADDAIAEVQPLVDNAAAFAASAAASALTASTAVTDAQNQATAATGSAGNAANSAMTANHASFQALDSENLAQTAATEALNSSNTALGAEAICVDYGVLTQAWAEHMPDPIPPNILAVMGVTGDHWSSRWWANRAAAAFGAFSDLYLGVFASPPTTTSTGGAIPIGAIYYNSTLEQVFVWNGQEWAPFYAPTKALTLTLMYRSTAGQTTFNLTTPDILGNTWTITSADPEPLEVHANGLRLQQTLGAQPGDWSLNAATSVVTLVNAPVLGTLILVDILAPASTLPPGRVTTQQLLDFDINPTTGAPGQIDGTRVTFPLALMTPPHNSITVARAVDLLVFIDGVTQKPGNDFNVTGTNITFGEAPVPGGAAWALWFAPDLGALATTTELVAEYLGSRAVPVPAPDACICPVGTVMTSLLPPEQFVGEVGADWVLCDGRDIAGTKLAGLLGSDTLPNLQTKLKSLYYYARVD